MSKSARNDKYFVSRNRLRLTFESYSVNGSDFQFANQYGSNKACSLKLMY